jgi:hypothetical protein
MEMLVERFYRSKPIPRARLPKRVKVARPRPPALFALELPYIANANHIECIHTEGKAPYIVSHVRLRCIDLDFTILTANVL